MLKKIYTFLYTLWCYPKRHLFSMLGIHKSWKWFKRGIGFILTLFLISTIWQNMHWISPKSFSLSSYYKPVAHQKAHAKHIGLIDIRGAIIDSDHYIIGNTAQGVIRSITTALNNPNAVGIILRINSAGSNLVSASQIYEIIREQKKHYPHKPIIAVCETMCTRASYYLATACDAIFAEASSMVGGIGLHYEQIGYVGSLKKLNIQRRLSTAGRNKAALDQYSPINPEAREMMQGLLNDWHEQLIEGIKIGRGDRLKNLETNAESLFSGRIWLGAEALDLGLIDGIGDFSSVAEDVIKQTQIVDYSIRPNIMQSILGIR